MAARYLEVDYSIAKLVNGGTFHQGTYLPKIWNVFWVGLSPGWKTPKFIAIVDKARKLVIEKNEHIWIALVSHMAFDKNTEDRKAGLEKARKLVLNLLNEMSSMLDINTHHGDPICPEEEPALWRNVDRYYESVLSESPDETDSLEVSKQMKRYIAAEAVHKAWCVVRDW